MAKEKIIGALLCLLALSACGDGSLREKMGLERKPPDEFKVLARPPLTVPPDFNLRPPVDDRDAIGASNISHDARTLLLGDAPAPDAPATAAPTSAEEVILQRAGADKTPPTVRDIIRSESGENADESDKSTLEKLREPLKKADPIVDPAAEQKRILTNEEQGKDITEGETPTVKPRSESLWDRIF